LKVVAIIQARMGSTRLPGKVLRVLGSRTVLAHVIRRVQSAPNIEEIVVATTEASNDDAIVKEARLCDTSVFRGSENDVLSRYFGAAKQSNADVVVRVTSDCPLLETRVLREMVTRFHTLNVEGKHVDYLSNTLTRTYPRGLDVEIFTIDALKRAHREASSTAEREHVTPYIYHHPQVFNIDQFKNEVDISYHRWTLDTEDDWNLLTQIFSHLDKGNNSFSLDQVIELLNRESELSKINAHVVQKAIGH
jgi:spore coat polysaccharide biosynthesis protein SpsF